MSGEAWLGEDSKDAVWKVIDSFLLKAREDGVSVFARGFRRSGDGWPNEFTAESYVLEAFFEIPGSKIWQVEIEVTFTVVCSFNVVSRCWLVFVGREFSHFQCLPEESVMPGLVSLLRLDMFSADALFEIPGSFFWQAEIKGNSAVGHSFDVVFLYRLVSSMRESCRPY